MTPQTEAKARRLREQQRIRRLPGAQVFGVDGDHGTHIVVIHDGRAHCSCPARGECAHIRATRGDVATELRPLADALYDTADVTDAGLRIDYGAAPTGELLNEDARPGVNGAGVTTNSGDSRHESP